MSKRNQISYVKPSDPSFLAKLKAQIGYSEGPTTDTKRQKLQDDCSDSGGEEDSVRPERDDEQPQIVVLHTGDLTAEEVATEQERLAREAATAPADLNQPIVFRKRNKSKDVSIGTKTVAAEENTVAICAKAALKEKKPKSKSKKQQPSKLSFNNFDEDEEEELEADQ